MEARLSSASATTMSQTVLTGQANMAGNMHGGEIMKIMDATAAVAGQRHAQSHNVVTAYVDRMILKEPIFIGDVVICKAEVVYVGKTSMEIFVTVEAENLARGETKLVLEGDFTFVALDRNGRPTSVPPLLIETEEQKQRFDAARSRVALKKASSQ